MSEENIDIPNGLIFLCNYVFAFPALCYQLAS